MAMLFQLMLLPLLFIQIGVAESIISDSSLRLQLDQLNQLNYKISLLVSRIDKSTIDLQLAKSASLQSELQLQRINEEQNAWIRKTKHALQVAEEEMMKAKLEASSVFKQLEEEARKFTDFYVDQVPVVMKPHIDKPYTDEVPHHYWKVKEIVCLYHNQALTLLNLALEFMCEKPKEHSCKHLQQALTLLNLALEFMCEKPKKQSRKTPYKPHSS